MPGLPPRSSHPSPGPSPQTPFGSASSIPGSRSCEPPLLQHDAWGPLPVPPPCGFGPFGRALRRAARSALGVGSPSAASSHQSLPGLLHPGAGHEVHRVSSPQPVRLSPPFHHTTSPWLGGLRPRTSTPPDGGTALRHRGGKAEDPAARLRCARFPAMLFTPFEEPARWSLPVRPLAPEPCRVAAVVAPSPFFSLRSRLPWSSPRALASQRSLGSWHRVAYGLGAFLPVACVTRARAVASLDLGSPSFHWASFPFEIRSFLRSPLPARRSLAA